MAEIIPDTSEADIARLFSKPENQELFAGFMNSPEVQEVDELDQVNVALELLREHIAKTSEQ